MKPASRWSAERGGAWCAGYILAMLGVPGGAETVGRTKGHSKGVTRRPLGMPASQPAARASDTAAHAGSAHPTPVAQVLGAGAATGFEGRRQRGTPALCRVLCCRARSEGRCAPATRAQAQAAPGQQGPAPRGPRRCRGTAQPQTSSLSTHMGRGGRDGEAGLAPLARPQAPQREPALHGVTWTISPGLWVQHTQFTEIRR